MRCERTGVSLMWCGVVRASRGMSALASLWWVRVWSSIPWTEDGAHQQGQMTASPQGGWGRVGATTTADTGQVAEGWREPTGGVGLLKASSTSVTQGPVIVWKQTYQIIQLFCTNQPRIPRLQFILFLSTGTLS